MDDRHSFFAQAVSFLVAFVGDDDDGLGHDAGMARFVDRVARFVVDAPSHGGAVVGAVAGVLAEARLARDAG